MWLLRRIKRNFNSLCHFRNRYQIALFLSLTAVLLIINEIFLEKTTRYYLQERDVGKQRAVIVRENDTDNVEIDESPEVIQRALILRANETVIAGINGPPEIINDTDSINVEAYQATDLQSWKYFDKRYYPIHGQNDTDFYFYSAFLDDRVHPAMIRLIGLKGKNFNHTVYCRFPQENADGHFQTATYLSQPIFDNWPCRRKNCRHTAYIYSCVYPQLLSHEAASTVTIVIDSKVTSVTLPILNGDGLNGKRKDMGLCLKSVTGNINATRMIEWIELNRLLGVDRVIVYNTNVTSDAINVFNDYAARGIVELIPDLFPEKVKVDTKSFPDGNTHHLDFYWLQQQAYLVAYNDCLYRFRKNFKYLLIIDYDEVIVPNRPSTLTKLVDKLFSIYPNTSAFSFKSAQHLTYFGAEDNAAPPYLHMMHYLRRTKVVFSQPKSVIDPTKALMINWHTVVANIEPYNDNTSKLSGYATNILVAEYEKYGFVHHYRYRCRSNNRKECRDKRKGLTVDEVMPLYMKQLDVRVRKARRRQGFSSSF